MLLTAKNLLPYDQIFWDVDGTIIDSLHLKADAYAFSFRTCSLQTIEYIRSHHLSHPGMGRHEKLKLYHNAACPDEAFSESILATYQADYSNYIKQNITPSLVVKGFRELMLKLRHLDHIVVTAMSPHDLEIILDKCSLSKLLTKQYSGLSHKDVAISHHGLSTKSCLIGDSREDLMAATRLNIDFFMRLHDLNKGIFSDYKKLNTFEGYSC